MEFLSTIAATIASGVWSVVSALLILVIAFVVAAVVKSAVVKLLGKGKIGQILDKMDSPGGGSTRDFIGKLVHLLVFLLFVPGIFSALGMRDVSAPITNLLNYHRLCFPRDLNLFCSIKTGYWYQKGG